MLKSPFPAMEISIWYAVRDGLSPSTVFSKCVSTCNDSNCGNLFPGVFGGVRLGTIFACVCVVIYRKLSIGHLVFNTWYIFIYIIYLYTYSSIKSRNNSCEKEDFVESTICNLRVLHTAGFNLASCCVYSPYMRKTKSEAADFKEWVCLFLVNNIEPRT